MRTYEELIQLPTFEERLKYLQTGNVVGHSTFGYDRYLNQAFYRSREWKQVRDYVIVRDNSCDLAIPEMELRGGIVIHHMNPITPDDLNDLSVALDPRFLITTCDYTHNLIHYGTDVPDSFAPVERFRNDTSPWRL